MNKNEFTDLGKDIWMRLLQQSWLYPDTCGNMENNKIYEEYRN